MKIYINQGYLLVLLQVFMLTKAIQDYIPNEKPVKEDPWLPSPYQSHLFCNENTSISLLQYLTMYIEVLKIEDPDTKLTSMNDY